MTSWRLVLCAVALAGLAGCKRKPPSAVDADAGVAPIRESEATPEPAAAPPVSADVKPLPLSDELALVAVGKRTQSRILWLNALGSRVWLSGVNLDAYADGDGPLAKAPDLLKGLPYQQGIHSFRFAGNWPRIYALRTKQIEGRDDSPEPTVFIRRDDGSWKQAKSIKDPVYPEAFLPWGEGVLFIFSQIERGQTVTYVPDVPGTTLVYVAPDGTVSDPKLPIDRAFVTWSADSDGTTLSLLGAKGIPAPKGSISGVGDSVVLVRGNAKDGFTSTTLLKPGIHQDTLMSHVHESGVSAVISPPPYMTVDDGAWKPSPTSTYVVRDGKVEHRKVPVTREGATVASATAVGDAVYVVRKGWADSPDAQTILRMRGDAVEKLPLPKLAPKEGGGFRLAKTGEKGALPCWAEDVVVREKEDVWIWAGCGAGPNADQNAVPAVFRRGRAQDEPVIIP